MTESHQMAPEPQESRPPGEREARIHETMGMVRRMTRNGEFRLVEVEPAKTPHMTIVDWAAELEAKPTPTDLSELVDRLHDALPFEADGALAGQRVVDALVRQAGLIRSWPLRARLGTLAAQLQALLRELGML